MRSSVESVRAGTYGSAGGQGFLAKLNGKQMGMGQNLVPLVNIKIAGKWMFIPLKMVLIGIDPYPNENMDGYGVLWCVFGRFHPQIRFETWKNPAGKSGIARIVGMNQNWAPQKIAWLTIRLLIDIL